MILNDVIDVKFENSAVKEVILKNTVIFPTKEYNLPSSTWEQGGIRNNGADYDSYSRVRNTQYIPVSGNSIFKLEIDSRVGYSDDLMWGLSGYKSDYTSDNSYAGDWVYNGSSYGLGNLPQDTAYVRISLRYYHDGSEVVFSENDIIGANYTLS